jgi:hypothetical protein
MLLGSFKRGVVQTSHAHIAHICLSLSLSASLAATEVAVVVEQHQLGVRHLLWPTRARRAQERDLCVCVRRERAWRASHKGTHAKSGARETAAAHQAGAATLPRATIPHHAEVGGHRRVDGAQLALLWLAGGGGGGAGGGALAVEYRASRAPVCG